MSGVATTQVFLPPDEAQEVDITSKTITEELPIPDPIQGSDTKITGKRTRSVAKSPKVELKKARSTPIKAAREIFQSLLRNETVPEARLRSVLGGALFKMVAAPKNPTTAVKVALVEGADPNHNDPVTALYVAVDNNNEAYCRLLLDHGASIVQKNKRKDVNTLPIAMALAKPPGSKIYKMFVEHVQQLERNTHNAPHVEVLDGENGQNVTPLRGDDGNEPPRKRQRTNSTN